MAVKLDRQKFWKYVRRTVLIAVVLSVLPYLLFFLAYVASAIHNKITLNNFSAPFLEYPLPPQTIETDRELMWGAIGGAGHLCGFKATRVLSSELNLDEMKAYYRGVTFPVVVSERTTFDAIAGLDGETVVIVMMSEDSAHTFEVSIADGMYGYTFWDLAC